MSFAAARKIADAVLYEGYVLYPYRPSSLKNQFRWQFGVIAPPAWADDPSFMQTECRIEPQGAASIDVLVRFLQVQPKTEEWDEGVERTMELSGIALEGEYHHSFEFAPIKGVVRISSRRNGEFIKVRLRIENETEFETTDRNQAMRHALTSTHALLRVSNGAFVSALDSPDCENVHAWPVLVGKRGDRSVMLSSPIILEDYPAIAPESAGDFFDGTEIDEMLTFRVMTMTDEEKREAAASDERARRIIERCDNMAPDELERLHGTLRGRNLDALKDDVEEFFNPAAEQPETQSIPVGSGAVCRGSRVRLAPHRRADSMDMFLKGRTARVESVHRDLEDRAYVAVSVDDDPAEGIGRRFFYFFPDELELMEKET
jgi:hypothetical protein